MGWLSFLKTTPKVVDIAGDIVTGSIAGIDKLFFTNEEKAEAGKEVMELWLETQKILRDESTVRSMTRRFLACMIMGEFLLFLLMAVLCWPLMPQWSKFILEVAKSLATLTLAVGVFYFGSYAISAHVMGKKKK